MKKIVMIVGSIMILLCNIFMFSENVSAKVSETDFSENKTALASEMEQYIYENNPHDAAVSVSVVNDQEVLYQGTFGFINKEKDIPADVNTIYEWGSLSKVLTWISVIQLAEQGKIDLQEDICNYLPEHFLKKVKYDAPITMIDLMNHTAGWQDSITNVYTDNCDNILPLAEYVSKYQPIQLYEPGTTVAYSNWGTTLAGYIVELISGEPYCDYVTNHIFTPLGMDQTSIEPLHNDNTFVKNGLTQMTGYTTDGVEIAGKYYAPDYPAAGAAGSMKDIQLLMKAFLTDTNNPLFEKDETLQTMLEATYTFAGTNTPENAHGLWYDFYQTPSLGHYGNTTQCSVHMSLAPAEKLGFIVLTNQAQEMALNHGLGEIVFGENTEKQEGIYQPLSFEKNYTCARTIEKGYCRFYHFFQIYQVRSTGDDSIIISSPFMEIPCTRMGDNVYCANDGFVKGYQFYMEESNGVANKISTSTFDLIPYSSGKVLFETVSFLLLAIALLVSLVLCIVNLFRLCKGKKQYGFTLLMNLLSLLVFAGIFMEAGRLITTAASTKDMIPYVFFYSFYIAFGLSYMVYFIKSKQKEITKVLSLVTSVYIIAFLLYWEMIFI